jgi:hypothetical protein
MESSDPDEAWSAAAVELATTYYSAARAEVVTRLAQRDSVLFLYLGAVATLLSVFLSKYPQGLRGVVVVPLLSLGACMVYSQHLTVIGALRVYLGEELHEDTRPIHGDRFRSWEASAALVDLKGHVVSRFLSSVVILIGPSAAAIALLITAMTDEVVPSSSLTPLLLAFAIALAVGAVVTLMSAHWGRTRSDKALRDARARQPRSRLRRGPAEQQASNPRPSPR